MTKEKQPFFDIIHIYHYKIGDFEFTTKGKVTIKEGHPHNIWKTLEAFNLFIHQEYSKKAPDEEIRVFTQEQWESIEMTRAEMGVILNGNLMNEDEMQRVMAIVKKMYWTSDEKK